MSLENIIVLMLCALVVGLIVLFEIIGRLRPRPGRTRSVGPPPPPRRGISIQADGSIHIVSNRDGTTIESETGGRAVVDGREVILAAGEKKFFPPPGSS